MALPLRHENKKNPLGPRVILYDSQTDKYSDPRFRILRAQGLPCFCLQNFNKTASVTDMLSDLKWDTLELRRKKNRLTVMYKLSHNLVDITTEEYLIPNSEKRTRNSHAFKYRLPEVSKDVFKFSFFPRSIREWNSLPADLVNYLILS